MKANQAKIGTRAIIARESKRYSLAKNHIGEKVTIRWIDPKELTYTVVSVNVSFDNGYGEHITGRPAPWWLDLDCLDELPEGE